MLILIMQYEFSSSLRIAKILTAPALLKSPKLKVSSETLSHEPWIKLKS